MSKLELGENFPPAYYKRNKNLFFRGVWSGDVFLDQEMK